MQKRILSAIEKEMADSYMMETAGRMAGMRHMVTARMAEDGTILLLTFYSIPDLMKGKREAAFRTFFSRDDYITQDLKAKKVKWLTASFCMMDGFNTYEGRWNAEKSVYEDNILVYIRSGGEMKLITEFFKEYADPKDELVPWDAIDRFQNEVKARRLAEKHKKETDRIDAVMEPVREEPEAFRSWAFESALSFSRYLIYKEVKRGSARCECTHCGKTGLVDRTEIRLKNNEKGVCPFCGSRVTIKAEGRLHCGMIDKRWVVYVDSTDKGFIWRCFHVYRRIYKYPDQAFVHKRVSQEISECARVFYTFSKGRAECDAYEYAEFKQTGKMRWCHAAGKIDCRKSILYPGNLPQAWAHTPMKYSALELLSEKLPTTSLEYEHGIKQFLKYPKLEWICKMGLTRLAKEIISDTYYCATGKINLKGETIFKILGLNKVNTRILQDINGSFDELRLLQVAQTRGLQLKPDQLKEYYDSFGCNTELLGQAGRKVSLHKLVKYIEKESRQYPQEETCVSARYRSLYQECKDAGIAGKQNMARDWLEYLGWCKTLKYDLDSMFIYMPNNFKNVHDRVAKEYEALQDKKAAAERKRQEALARKKMEQTRKFMEEIFKKNEGRDAFSIQGNGLVLVVPKNGDEIKAEGEALHHCVGGYVDRVARGETSIFFIRKADAPDTPYFTLEYRDNKVIQCRGFKNCGMKPEVEAFVNEFEKKMQDAVHGQKKNRGQRKAG